MTQVWAIFHHNVLNPNVSRAISPMNDTHKKKSSYKCKMEKKHGLLEKGVSRAKLLGDRKNTI